MMFLFEISFNESILSFFTRAWTQGLWATPPALFLWWVFLR
jgi:hypothetical protein